MRILTAVLALFPLLSTPALAEIRIGLAVPLSGQFAAVGDQLRRGTEQAVADLNAKGGVLGEKLVLVVADDGGVPTQAVSVANRLATDGVVLVVGHLQSGTTIPAAKVYEEEGIVVITPTATAPDVTEGGQEMVFRTCGRDDQQGAVAGPWLAGNFKGKRVAVINDQTTYGKGLADATTAAMKARDLTPVYEGTLTAGEKDFTALVTALKAAEVEAVYYGGYYPEAALLVRQARDQGLKAQFVSGDTLASGEFWSIAGDKGEGMAMTFSADARTLPAAQAALASLRANGPEPGAYTLYAYAAVQVWAGAAEKAGSSDGLKVAKALRQGQVPTAIGPLGFDAKGDRTSTDYVMYRWSKGSYAPIR
ncbi:branched-chain amino acid ABC transporter substrate-binding protein [Oleisolibacter albus]|uniref:branched-chain amino acid ABC transporter substrate-binding protein n=1 Tax=Oleisolibacter albus TaxID=2171757 RepID=UPI000DF2AE26|nr:branched-chain amino acid ABC transporter substrate-binding protein [Oleisolibacter albus]